jgi:hypothetical protein
MIPTHNSNQQTTQNLCTKVSTAFENAERPFTELLALLSMPQVIKSKKGKRRKKERERFCAISNHTTNAMASLLWGMQSFGHLFAVAAMTKELNNDHIVKLGNFVKLQANLLEALHIIRGKAWQSLKN